jgi:hypothetical protein
MRGPRSWWKGGPASAVRSSAIWAKCRRLVEPHLIRYGGADGRVTAAADITLMGQFQSLGDNCEFGLVQRQLGAEPLGLFRFAHTMIDGLIAAFESRFIALQSPENIEVRYGEFPNGDFEYVTSVPQYQFNSHAAYQSGKMSADERRSKEMKRLNFLARNLIEDAESGEKIFVYKSNVPLAEQRIKDLYRAIDLYGPSWLLWVTPATADWPAGRVDEVSERFLRGSIDRFAPYELASDFSVQGWRTICSNAYHLWAARRPARA